MSKYGVHLRTERELFHRPDEGYDGEAIFEWLAESEKVSRRQGNRTITEMSSMTAREAAEAEGLARRFAADGVPTPVARRSSIDEWFDAAEGLRTLLIEFMKEYIETTKRPGAVWLDGT